MYIKVEIKKKYIIASRHFSELFKILILVEIWLGLIFGPIGLNFKLQQATEVGTGLPEVKHEGYFAGSVSPNVKQSQISAKMKSKHVDFLVVLV